MGLNTGFAKTVINYGIVLLVVGFIGVLIYQKYAEAKKIYDERKKDKEKKQ